MRPERVCSWVGFKGKSCLGAGRGALCCPWRCLIALGWWNCCHGNGESQNSIRDYIFVQVRCGGLPWSDGHPFLQPLAPRVEVVGCAAFVAGRLIIFPGWTREAQKVNVCAGLVSGRDVRLCVWLGWVEVACASGKRGPGSGLAVCVMGCVWPPVCVSGQVSVWPCVCACTHLLGCIVSGFAC